jgi:hypothetical protein
MQMGEEGPIVELPVDLVARLLNDAKGNGYDVSGWTVEEICLDLLAYAEDCETATVEQLTPLVKAWKGEDMQHIVVIGNVVDGLTFEGPFDTAEGAIEYADANVTKPEWVVAPLVSPEAE